ncbi:phage holin family protein [Prochlorococcus sp. MIT 1307]|uniref:phage holin family protein n=1 Tax=Prochlorococcus sp. MIT 1307 TaxID=3096219 RepID=UPI002A762BC9|nr:phage holin family protein [Prochlorococcus sp. MIT 1307]
MSESQRPRGLGAAARVTALASSVMDLHVRIALQEMDREKRRLISGGIFLAMGAIFMLFALLALEIMLVIWMKNTLNWQLEWILLGLGLIDLALAGLSLRIGGYLAKGPYLPETLEGLSRTTKAVLGKS